MGTGSFATPNVSNPKINTKSILRPMLSTNRSINIGNPLSSAVHVIASQSMGTSMIRVQNLKNISSMDVNSGGSSRTLPTVSSGTFLFVI